MFMSNFFSFIDVTGVYEVSIRLDLETVFQFSHLVLTFKVKHSHYLMQG